MKALVAKPPRAKTTAAAKSRRTRRSVETAKTSDIIEMVPLVLGLKRILVPIDFSQTSLKALQYAVPFARQFGAKITLLHVVGPATYPQEFGYMGISEVEVSRLAQKRLKALAGRAIQPELLGEVLVRHGIVFDTIVETARSSRADLVIATTHGYTGLKHVLMGSTAERIVRHAPCPVLIVREREHEFV